MGLSGARMRTHSNPSARSVLGLRVYWPHNICSRSPVAHFVVARRSQGRVMSPRSPTGSSRNCACHGSALRRPSGRPARRHPPVRRRCLCSRPAGSRQVHGAMRPGRCVSSKNGLQAFRSAEAQIRHCRSEFPMAQLIPVRRSDNPSRSRHRKARAGRPFFRPSGRGAEDLMRARRAVPWRRTLTPTR